MSVRETLALVIPTINEAGCISRVLDETRQVLSQLQIPYEILVVDDQSSDGTAQIVAGIASMDPKVRLLLRRQERGLAGAVLHGWRHTEATLLGVMDADLQHPPALLPELLQAIRTGADLAVASRYADGLRSTSWTGLRRHISMLSIWLAHPLQRRAIRVKDPLSGFFLVRRHCVTNTVLGRRGFKLLLDILTRGRVRRVIEVPFEFGPREAGRSKAGVRVAWDYLVLLVTLYIGRWRDIGLMSGTSD